MSTPTFEQGYLTCLSKTVTITSAHLKAMTGAAGTDVVILPSPGVGNIIVVESAFLNFHYGGIAYTTGTGNLQLLYNQGGSHVLTIAAPVLTSTQLKAVASVAAFQPPLVTASIASNASLVANLSTAVQYLAGNGTVEVSVIYRIVPYS